MHASGAGEKVGGQAGSAQHLPDLRGVRLGVRITISAAELLPDMRHDLGDFSLAVLHHGGVAQANAGLDLVDGGEGPQNDDRVRVE